MFNSSAPLCILKNKPYNTLIGQQASFLSFPSNYLLVYTVGYLKRKRSVNCDEKRVISKSNSKQVVKTTKCVILEN